MDSFDDGDLGRGDLNFLVLGCKLLSGDFDSGSEIFISNLMVLNENQSTMRTFTAQNKLHFRAW